MKYVTSLLKNPGVTLATTNGQRFLRHVQHKRVVFYFLNTLRSMLGPLLALSPELYGKVSRMNVFVDLQCCSPRLMHIVLVLLLLLFFDGPGLHSW